jgi:hypothetical protein
VGSHVRHERELERFVSPSVDRAARLIVWGYFSLAFHGRRDGPDDVVGIEEASGVQEGVREQVSQGEEGPGSVLDMRLFTRRSVSDPEEA